ncbi:Hypothetical protein PHPALM_6250 [Phytophthora palmivora]|uniref:Uncharacterized protein n=1 Tax=Phytophthora palmivora TaxID=4796 RepID=A0A2P4YFD1_9STRA|nr:Hypothetical protein PHPALM_6250 [Phytophthora palmivora]
MRHMSNNVAIQEFRRLTAVHCPPGTWALVIDQLMQTSRSKTNDDIREENTRLRHGFSRGMWPDMEKLQMETHTNIYTNGKGWRNTELSLKFLNVVLQCVSPEYTHCCQCGDIS